MNGSSPRLGQESIHSIGNSSLPDVVGLVSNPFTKNTNQVILIKRTDIKNISNIELLNKAELDGFVKNSIHDPISGNVVFHQCSILHGESTRIIIFSYVSYCQII
mgnify:CR=1 FL=1